MADTPRAIRTHRLRLNQPRSRFAQLSGCRRFLDCPHMADDIQALMDETQALKVRARDLANSLYTTGRDIGQGPAPPHRDLYLVALSGQAFAAELLLERIQTALEQMP